MVVEPEIHTLPALTAHAVAAAQQIAAAPVPLTAPLPASLKVRLIDAKLDVAALGDNRYVVFSALIALPPPLTKRLCAVLFYPPDFCVFVVRVLHDKKQTVYRPPRVLPICGKVRRLTANGKVVVLVQFVRPRVVFLLPLKVV